MDRLHEDAQRLIAELIAKYGANLPEDLRTTLSYYVSCRNGYDRAAKHVLVLRRMGW